MSGDPNDSIQCLARIAVAAVDLMALMHRADRAGDPDEAIAHIQANLDLVRREVAR